MNRRPGLLSYPGRICCAGGAGPHKPWGVRRLAYIRHLDILAPCSRRSPGSGLATVLAGTLPSSPSRPQGGGRLRVYPGPTWVATSCETALWTYTRRTWGIGPPDPAPAGLRNPCHVSDMAGLSALSRARIHAPSKTEDSGATAIPPWGLRLARMPRRARPGAQFKPDARGGSSGEAGRGAPSVRAPRRVWPGACPVLAMAGLRSPSAREGVRQCRSGGLAGAEA